MNLLLLLLGLSIALPIQLLAREPVSSAPFKAPTVPEVAEVAARDAELARYREAPLRELQTVRTLHARDFGVEPDTERNQRGLIQKALDALAGDTEPVELLFAPGRYFLDAPVTEKGERNAMLLIRDTTNAVVNFNGAEFSVGNPSSGFLYVDQSENVIVKNASVDYDPIPHTEGIIRAVDRTDSSIDLEIREGFPPPDQDYFHQAGRRWGCQLDPHIPGRLKSGSVNFHHYTDVKPLGERLFRIGLQVPESSTWETIEVGDRFALLARTNGSFFFANHSRQITAMNLTTWNVPAGHYVSVMTDAYNILGCRALIKPGFWKGGNADAVHCQSNRTGPWIEDCVFEGVSDDSLVIYTRPFSVVRQLAPNRLEISRLGRGRQVRPMPLLEREIVVGDVLDFLNPQTGVIVATAAVTAYDPETRMIELDGPVRGLDPGIDKSKTQVWNRAIGHGFVMRNNRLLNSRRYGIYLKASNGLIEGNHIEGLSSAAISLHNESNAPNGPFCHDVDILNNTIIECGFDKSFLKYEDIGVLRAASKRLDHGNAESGTVHSNLRIENNRFSGLLRPPVFLGNVNGAIMRGNTLDGRPFAEGDTVIHSSVNIELQ